MHESGLADIQSHSVTHTWYPIAPRVVDTFDAGKKAQYPWLLWNEEPSEKVRWLQLAYERFAGMPVFEHERSLKARRFLFDLDMLAHFQRRVASRRLSVAQANQLLEAEYRYIGRHEGQREQQCRYTHEIAANADFIEASLGYRPSVLCWPGGAYDSVSQEIAYQYHPVTTIKQGYGQDEKYLHRMSATNPYGLHRFPWKHRKLTLLYYISRYALKSRLSLRSFKGRYTSRIN